MTDDEYEILPHQELEYLRREVERLKKNPFGDTETGQTLLDSMNNLTLAINRLLSVLQTANDEMVKDYHENKVSDRMDRITEQNQKLAEGIVAVGELVKQVMTQEKRNAAIHGGFVELSDFTTDLKKAKTNAPKGTPKNPFEQGLPPSPATAVKLDAIPKQDFSMMDPQTRPGLASPSGMELPDFGDLPPMPGMEGFSWPQALPPPPSDDIPVPKPPRR